MKKRFLVGLMAVVMLLGLISVGSPALAAQDYVWKLVEVVDYDQEESWEQANKHEAYNYDPFYSRGNYFVKQSYIGRGGYPSRLKDGKSLPTVHGEGVKLSCTISAPPETLVPEQDVSLTLTLSASENTQSFFAFGASANVDFYPDPDIAPNFGRGTRFKNKDGYDYFGIGENPSPSYSNELNHGNYQTLRETIIAKAPRISSEGQKIALRQKFVVGGIPMATYYIYEAQVASSTPTPSPGTPSPSRSFSDLSSSHWAHDTIMEMVELGILSGYSDGTFKPNNSVTRAEFATIMVKALDLTATAPRTATFADVPSSHWAYGVVESAKDYLTGYRDSGTGQLTFQPGNVAVREDVAVAIVKAQGLGNAQANLSLLERFDDHGQISQSLREHVAIAVEYGYMQGSNIGFEPQKPLTRAEACALLSRIIKESGTLEKVPM